MYFLSLIYIRNTKKNEIEILYDLIEIIEPEPEPESEPKSGGGKK